MLSSNVEAHSSSGLGHRPLKAEIRGSNPLCATTRPTSMSESGNRELEHRLAVDEVTRISSTSKQTKLVATCTPTHSISASTISSPAPTGRRSASMICVTRAQHSSWPRGCLERSCRSGSVKPTPPSRSISIRTPLRTCSITRPKHWKRQLRSPSRGLREWQLRRKRPIKRVLGCRFLEKRLEGVHPLKVVSEHFEVDLCLTSLD